jgi:amidohydrolase
MDGVTLSPEVSRQREELVSLRRHFHRNPELGFQEGETSSFIAKYLRGLGFEVREGVGKTGVIGLLRGAKAGKTLLYRADMDALRVREENVVEYRSGRDGVSHACGHDAHMAVALSAAKLLAGIRQGFAGNVKFLFQPNEELAPGGAGLMIEEGAMENPRVDGVLGLHVWQGIPAGSVGIKAGPVFAAVDLVSLTVKGRGGHGALPHQAVDPVLVSAHILIALQAFITREIDPLKPAVLTFGSIDAGTASNVIPETARIKGTFRYFDPDLHAFAGDRIGAIARGVAEGLRARCEVEITRGYPPLFNDPGFAGIVLDAARELLPPDRVVETEMTMGSEDMSLFLGRAPGCYFLLGTANSEKGLTNPHHSPRFDIDEDALPLGLEIAKRSALKFLGN